MSEECIEDVIWVGRERGRRGRGRGWKGGTVKKEHRIMNASTNTNSNPNTNTISATVPTTPLQTTPNIYIYIYIYIYTHSIGLPHHILSYHILSYHIHHPLTPPLLALRPPHAIKAKKNFPPSRNSPSNLVQSNLVLSSLIQSV